MQSLRSKIGCHKQWQFATNYRCNASPCPRIVSSQKPCSKAIQRSLGSPQSRNLKAWATSEAPRDTASAAVEVPPATPTTDSLPPEASPPDRVDAVFGSQCGKWSWRVRPYQNGDYQAIVDLQTDSFHTPSPIPALNQLAYTNFRAEVVDAMRAKMKTSDPAIFQMFVAEEILEPAATVGPVPRGPARPPSSPPPPKPQLVGVCEVAILREAPVLLALPVPPGGAEEYVYLSSMCVKRECRRQGVAQALMAGAEAQARLWGQKHLVLHVHKDNDAAVRLYGAWGMRTVGQDPGWKGLLGGRIRLLMHKRVDVLLQGP